MTREKVLLDTGPLVAFLKIHLTTMLAPTNRVFRCASTGITHLASSIQYRASNNTFIFYPHFSLQNSTLIIWG